jgi:hypothetical protein
MGRKLIYLISVVLAFSLIGTSLGQAVDPNLVGWWKFDETSGTNAADSSGNGHSGTVNGNPQWVTGCFGGALKFDGSGDYVEIGYSPKLSLREFTVSAWVNVATEPGVFGVHGTRAGGDYTFDFKVQATNVHGDIGNGDAWLNTAIDITSTDIGTTGRGGDLDLDTWYMIAYVIDNTRQNVRLYLDGDLKRTIGISGTPLLMKAGESMRIGHTGYGSEWMNGLIDDVRVYNRALTTAEIKAMVPPKLKAYKPDPANGATGITMQLVRWTAGDTAAFHDVYFGTDQAAVAAADKSDTTGTYRGRVNYTMYWHLAGLTPGTTYYWRIDEVEADGTTIHTGDVWSFSAPPLTAWDPTPADGATNVMPATELKWNAGWGATKHRLCFGDSFTDVDSGTGGTDKGELLLSVTTYYTGPLYPETTYYWRVDENDGTTWLKGNIWSFSTSAGGSGVTREWWLNIGGTALSALTADPRFPDDPTGREVLNTFEGPVDWADNYGSRLYGWLMPPESGDYTFWIATDDGGQLWLSTDADPANKVIIASVSGWVPSRDFDGTAGVPGANQKSAAISLVAGQRYYIEALMKEGGGGDNIAVAWQGGPITARQIISGGYVSLGPFAPVRAYGPIPADKATDVSDSVTLRWMAGQKAAMHNVYFGTDATAVANATTATTGIYRGQQSLAATSYTPIEVPLQWSTTYYWRIDEVNPAEPDGPWKGAVWSFTTANYIPVDDFEDYTDDVGSRIFQTWKDGYGYTTPPPGYAGNGTGSGVGNSVPPYTEQTIFHGGGQSGQSLSMAYDNSGATGKARYSETFREWATPQNWTRNDVKALMLYVRGGNPVDFLESPPGTFTMSAEGTDIWGATDEFRYMYKQLSGDGEIIARVDRIAGPGTNEWAKAGVMIRETLNGTSKHAFMAVTPLASHGLAFQYRDGVDAGDSDSEHGVDVQTAPYWVKLVRKGNVFTGYHSPDGINWTMKDPSGDETDASNPVTIPMAANVYIGLALTSHENDVLRMAQFSNVSTSGSVTGAWTVADIDSTVTGTNSAEPLYVALEDSAGRVKVITNDNALAAAYPDWYELNIALSDFSAAGVNLAAVKKMYIGLGNRVSPTTGGMGKIYVDDIRLYQSRCVPYLAKPANDLSGNCVVDYLDLDIMAAQWLQTIPPATVLSADLNADKKVDFKDYALLADTWLDKLLWP